VTIQGGPQKQHLVSRGLQQNFALDHRVAVLDAQSGATLDQGRPTRSNWRIEDFHDRSLEDDFAKTERTALDQIRRITPSKISAEQRRALDLLVAIHLVRSLSFVKMHGQVTDAFFGNCVADFLADPQVLDAFVSERGPATGSRRAGIPY
jgi:hypothetical protein